MTDPNAHQVGGSHYRSATRLQHWDLMENYDVRYLEGNATKYLVRWPQKNGRQDLEKAMHYVDKILSSKRDSCQCCALTLADFEAFWDRETMDTETASIVFIILTWQNKEQLAVGRELLARLIEGQA